MRTLYPLPQQQKPGKKPENKGSSELIPANLTVQNREILPDYRQYISQGSISEA
jgi:hypothetical protein